MDLEAIRAYNQANLRGDREARSAALAQLGDPSREELVEMGIEGMSNPDRNARFQMVRLIGTQWCARTPHGILLGLNDAERRVRRLAAKLSAPYIGSAIGNAELEARLREIVDDEGETVKIRAAAFHSLSSGKFLSSLATSPREARKYFDEVPSLARYRAKALEMLVTLDPLTDSAREVLRYVVETGSKKEAVAATRALCGFKVMNIGGIIDPRERRRVAQRCEPAHGRVFYWVPRAGNASDSVG